MVGFAQADHLRTELALTALQLGRGQWHPQAAALVHHTDRGCQFTARAYQAVLAEQGITPSMSRSGNCYDNAMAESFNATIKAELVAQTHWATRAEARAAVFDGSPCSTIGSGVTAVSATEPPSNFRIRRGSLRRPHNSLSTKPG